jgi:hypothetical protein
MHNISIRAGLRHAHALLVQDKGALALYLALGVLVPFLMHGAEPTLSLRALVAVNAGGGFFGGSLAGPLYLFAIVALIWTAAQFALWNALLPDLREGPAGELIFGFVAGAAFLICYVVLTVLVALLPAMALALALSPIALTGPTGAVASTIIQTAANVAISAFIGSRLWLTGPIMAAEGSMNPLPALMQSWRRTARARGKLFGLYLLLQIVGGAVFAALITGHTAIILGDPTAQGYGEMAMAMAAAWLGFWLVVFVVQSFLAAGLYRSGDEGAASEVFA